MIDSGVISNSVHRLFAHVLADKYAPYLAILRTFAEAKAEVALHLRPADVRDHGRAQEEVSDIPLDEVKSMLSQWCERGNLKAHRDSRRGRWLILAASIAFASGISLHAQSSERAAPAPAAAVGAVTATGHERRIDLHWLPVATGKERFAVDRAEHPEGPFVTIAANHRSNIFSDFIGENERTYSYRVTRLSPDGPSQGSEGGQCGQQVDRPPVQAHGADHSIPAKKEGCNDQQSDCPLPPLPSERCLRSACSVGSAGFQVITGHRADAL